jgi:phage major head subunit gpT-like protein
MSIESKISVLTASLRSEFQIAYKATAEPAPWEQFTQIIPSTARIEHYTWMSPSPGIAQYQGHRRYGKIDTVRYDVENLEFDAGFEILMRDIRDDQTGGYMLKPKELAERAKKFPGRWVIKNGVAKGATQTCFDGSNFFATSHNIGTGNNLLTFTATNGPFGSDGLTYKIAALFTGGALKPILYQQRMGPDFETTGGTPQAKEAKIVRYWIDMEGQSAYGWWWFAVQETITNTPSVVDLALVMRNIYAAFRSFQLPKSLNSEDGEYPLEQEVFNSSNLVLVGPPSLEPVFDQLFNETWSPQQVGSNTVATTNQWKGKGKYIPSNFMGT